MEKTTTKAEKIQKELCVRYHTPSTHFSHESECSCKCPMFNERHEGEKSKCLKYIESFCEIQELFARYTDRERQEEFCKKAFSAYDTMEQDKEERVNHPKHYQHPSGVECITVARHHDFNIGNALKYLWRAGRKSEEGMSDSQKQIEDLEKAVFYIQDEIELLKSKQQ